MDAHTDVSKAGAELGHGPERNAGHPAQPCPAVGDITRTSRRSLTGALRKSVARYVLPAVTAPRTGAHRDPRHSRRRRFKLVARGGGGYRIHPRHGCPSRPCARWLLGLAVRHPPAAGARGNLSSPAHRPGEKELWHRPISVSATPFSRYSWRAPGDRQCLRKARSMRQYPVMSQHVDELLALKLAENRTELVEGRIWSAAGRLRASPPDDGGSR